MITCIACGCTDQNACVDELTGETCSWVLLPTAPRAAVLQINGGGLCTFCAEERPDLLEEPMYSGLLIEALKRGLAKPADSERDAPLVEVFSDLDADRFLRARRAVS